jgi:hypothetical protein
MAEILLEMRSTMNNGIHIIQHFKHQWNPDTTIGMWTAAVHKGVYQEAVSVLKNLQRTMLEQYGSEVLKYFNTVVQQDQRTSRTIIEDDEDKWFEDEEDDNERGILEEGFEFFLSPSEENSVASWGTGNTKYTELVQQNTQTTIVSSLTSEEKTITEVQNRKTELEAALRAKGITCEDQIQKILDGCAPFGFILKHIRYKEWSLSEEVEIILAMNERQHSKGKGAENPGPTNE